ncbi:ROK family transcriptional regulator [Bacillus sp. FJAT-50079]|uniref:ROK family transcriptional regulator n=1 Tax=Bacillus sp. FJAT-50079 TaxID=2833577 RepID=UPI001BC9EE44|nr:ROK family transcriptional regulator [Bacillus sp. FJAT-50079]MBS4206651.1 ROK family transcriptional regulator [Bacillus sp. FJAT-50079]
MMLETKHDQSMVRKHHMLLLFKLIKRFGPISRAELAKMTEMSATSTSRIVKELIDQHFIVEVGQTEGGVGRRAILLEVNPKGGLLLGVTIELDSIEVGIVDLNGSVLIKQKQEIDASDSPFDILDMIADLLNKMKNEYIDFKDRFMGCGVSIPGIVDWPSGKVVMIPQFHWSNIELRDYLEKKIGMSVFVDNQVKAILLGEILYGSAVGMESAACIYVGSGLGGAFMDKGDVVRGINNIAGEIGHTTIDPNGILCDCGRIGCLQTYICSSALEKESGKSINEIFAAKHNNERWAINLLDRASEYLAMTISNVACTYNPEVIVLAGPMIERDSDWVGSIKKKLSLFLWSEVVQEVNIHYQSEGSAGIIGASCLVLKEFLESPIGLVQQ